MNKGVLPTLWKVTLFLVSLVLIWFSMRVVLLLFAGLLIALILTSLTHLLRKLVPMRYRLVYGMMLFLLTGLVCVAGIFIVPAIAGQFEELVERVPKLFSDAVQQFSNSSAYQEVEEVVPDLKELVPAGGVGSVTRIFSSTFETVSGFVFVAFTAIFLAATPGLYRRILIKLFAPRLREDVERTSDRAIGTLKQWLLGQTVAMLAVGLVTAIALWIAGVPYAIALGIIAGIAEFIPIIGPTLSSIPALLLALSQGGDQFLIVLGIYIAIQLVEGNVITPLVQRKAVNLPPVVTLVALFLLGGAFGLLGVFVAAPFAALVLVLVEDIYLRRYLGTEDDLLV